MAAAALGSKTTTCDHDVVPGSPKSNRVDCLSNCKQSAIGIMSQLAWIDVSASGDRPSARSSHTIEAIADTAYVLGGELEPRYKSDVAELL